MKKLNLLFVMSLMAFVTLGMFSCSQNDDLIGQPISPKTRSVQVCKTRAQANMALVNYLELVGDKYVLNISQSEAEEIGVPETLYNGAQSEIAKTNEVIKELLNDPNTELELTDPQDIPETRSALDRPTLYSAPSGTLRTNGQEEAMSNLIWAPIGTKGIEFLCRANAAITPMYTCKTYSSGSWQSKTAVGAIGINTTVKVPLYVSNDYIKVAFSTTDSNGGTATYQGYN